MWIQGSHNSVPTCTIFCKARDLHYSTPCIFIHNVIGRHRDREDKQEIHCVKTYTSESITDTFQVGCFLITYIITKISTELLFLVTNTNWKHSESADLLGRDRSLLPYCPLLTGGERLPPHPPPPTKKKKKKKKKKRIITCTTIWVCYDYGVFCSFTHLRIPRSPPKFNQFFTVLNFLSDVVHRQTDKQTNQRYQKHNLYPVNIPLPASYRMFTGSSFAKEVMTHANTRYTKH